MINLKTAIVLAGGRGMRLRPYTETLPKPLIEIGGKPIIYWISKWLLQNGIEKIVIGVAHQKEKFYEWIETVPFKDKIVFSEHKVESGTGGGFKLAIKNGNVTDDVFLGMNGDEITDLPLSTFFRFHLAQKTTATLLATPLYSNFGVVNIDRTNKINSFEEKPMIEGTFINSGVYIFNKEIDSYLPVEGDIEKTAFVELAKKTEMSAYRYYGFWKTVNTEKDLEFMNQEIEFLKPYYEEH